jgi:hypothetical protein
MKDDEKKPPVATVSRLPRQPGRSTGPFGSSEDTVFQSIPHGPFGPIDENDSKYIEQRKEAERHVARSSRTHYVEQLSGVILVASIKAGREKTSAECIAKANEMADALGMGVADCDKQ